jgi:formamidopyrimidine-DNA glycosylase
MPELPDLEVFSHNLTKQLKGVALDKIVITTRAKTNVPKTKFQVLKGQKIKAVYREGKELRFGFTKDILGLHLMLHGKLYWQEDAPEKNTLLTLAFRNGSILGLTDFQGQARISLNPEASDVPDALDKTVTLAFWKDALQTKAVIKNVLLDQHVVRGIGNAYADEILWAAKISPFSIAGKIPLPAIRKLAAAVKKVLNNGIKQVKKMQPDIIGGEVRGFLGVHNAKKAESPTGKKILQKTAGGRKTYYTEEQELFT